jgi:hypothetical protein
VLVGATLASVVLAVEDKLRDEDVCEVTDDGVETTASGSLLVPRFQL